MVSFSASSLQIAKKSLMLQKFSGKGAGGIKIIRTATIGSSMFDGQTQNLEPGTPNLVLCREADVFEPAGPGFIATAR
jgi:hypothetical protein